MVYYIVSVLFLLFFWCSCMAINVSVGTFVAVEKIPYENIRIQGSIKYTLNRNKEYAIVVSPTLLT